MGLGAAVAQKARFSLAEQLESRTMFSTYLVTTTDDSGDGSLRQAILDANSHGGADVIQFSIGGSGVHTITPATALPALSDVTLLDGTSQPGYAGRPMIEINGSLAGANANGLELDAAGSEVTGLAINGFGGDGILIAAGADNAWIHRNFIGTDASGTSAAGNNEGVEIDAPSAMISSNLISGNTDAGVLVQNDGASIQGNFIGTDVTGTQAISNYNGITVAGAGGTTIGGLTSAARNVISGNIGDGIFFSGSTASGNVVQGNFIGVDGSGSMALGNAGNGIELFESSTVTIGGTASGARNIISGNSGSGVRLYGSSNNVIAGNYIGTDYTGEMASDSNGVSLGNSGSGVNIGFGSAGNLVGGTTPAGRNVIANSGGNGIKIATSGNVVNWIEGNYIGTDGSGVVAFGNDGNGITNQSAGTVITGNVISGNAGDGIDLADSATVSGNWIGTQADGSGALGNGGDGMFITGSASSISGNVIALNQGNGVNVVSGTGNAIRSNSIYGNALLGIDLGNDGATPNDSAGHSGANDFQDFPVITSITNNGTGVTIKGTISGPALSSMAIDLFANDAADPSGYGQGKRYLGTISVMTDANGNATFTATYANVVAGQYVTGTATDSSGNTSEFGLAMVTPAAPPPVVLPVVTTTTIQSSANPSTYGDLVTLTAVVNRSGSGATPTGSVTFMDGNTVLFTVALTNGSASCSTTLLAVGSHTITAIYNADSSFVTSTSAKLTQVVNAKKSTISGHIYNDVTGNGLSKDDTGLASVVVKLFLDNNHNGVLDNGDGAAVASATTGASGAYTFTNLPAGKYFVQETTPTGYVRTAPALATYYTNDVYNGTAVVDDFDNYKKCTCSSDVVNIKYVITDPIKGTKTVTDLRGNVREGDSVQVIFTVTGGHADTVSLVSYTAPGSTFVASQASKQAVYDLSTGSFGPGTYKLTVKVPATYFQVDFVCGLAIDQFGPENSNVFYSAQGRLFSADNG